jgi:hypothetical protein
MHCSVRTSQETQYVSATEPNRLMSFGETVTVCCENDTELTDTLCGQNAEFLSKHLTRVSFSLDAFPSFYCCSLYISSYSTIVKSSDLHAVKACTNLTVMWVSHLLRIQENSGCSHGPETDCSGRGISWFSSFPSCSFSRLKIRPSGTLFGTLFK